MNLRTGIPDGSSKTAILVEAADSVPWTKPEDIPFDPGKDLPKLGGFFDGSFNMLMANGSVTRVKKGFDATIMKLVIQVNDGWAFSLDSLGK